LLLLSQSPPRKTINQNQEAIDLFPGELWACPSCRPPFVRLSQFGYYEVNAAKLFYTDLLLGPPGAQPALPYNSKDMARALGMHEYYLALSEKPPSKPDDNNAFLYTWKANDPKDACFIVDCGKCVLMTIATLMNEVTAD